MPGSAEDWTDLDTPVDLWLMDLDTLELERLVENGRSPAWSPQAVSDPAQFNHWVLLPLIRREAIARTTPAS
jgi:hypothetical protein